MSEDRILRAAVLAPREFTASTLFGVYDILAAAGRDWDLVVNGVMGQSRIQPSLVARTTERLQASNGVWIEPDYALEDYVKPDLVCIPDIFVAPGENLEGRYDPELNWIRDRYEEGAVIATACGGSLLLAEAGLLNGLDAGTHWGYCNSMAEHYPKVRVQPNRALVVTGDEQRLVMAGGGSSWQDMTLYRIARLLGIGGARRVARVYLIDWHHVGQQPFARLARTRQVEDAVVARCQTWVAEHYRQPHPVRSLVRLSGLAERTFKRRFQLATGMAPLEYVHTLRIEEAKQMLETEALSIEAIANEVGYEDSAFFARLFRRQVGLTPAQYRKRFGGLRRAILDPAGVGTPGPLC